MRETPKVLDTTNRMKIVLQSKNSKNEFTLVNEMDNPQQFPSFIYKYNLFKNKDLDTLTMSGIIYCITFPSNKQYIGQTTQELDVRIKQHQRSKSSRLIYRAFQKYGNSYKVEILIEINKNLLDTYEIKFIDMFQTVHPNGYNLSLGGISGSTHSNESRKKMSESHKGIPLSEYHKAQLSKGRVGIVISDETKNKISSSNRKYFLNLPMYVYKIENGYTYRPPNCKTKMFTNKNLSDQEKLNLMLEYIKMENVQRLNVSGN